MLSLLAVRENVAAGLLAVIGVPGLDLGRRLRAVWTGAPQPPPGPVRDLIAVPARLAAPAEPGVSRDPGWRVVTTTVTWLTPSTVLVRPGGAS